MDLIGGYLLVILVLFAANIALILGNYKFNNVKLAGLSAVGFIISFALIYSSNFFNGQLSFLMDNFSYLFFIIFVVIAFIMLYYIKNNDFEHSLYGSLSICSVSIFLFASQSNMDVFSMISYSLLVFIMLFVVYQLSKLLHHAKRQYNVIISEYMSLFSIVIFIFALTYNSTKALKYTSFDAYLILTPTYQLIYAVIAIVVILIVGVFINDFNGGNS